MRGIRGVTLLELLVVVAIIGVLAAVAYPSYQRSVGKTWRSRAIACLEEIAVGMERRFTVTMSFVGTAPPPNSCVINGSPDWVVVDEELERRYGFGFAADPEATTFVV
ncbi:MAG: prepilin-type N-terminal cleavage/methylation domain-containing protein, partial [Planctomycetes bacterium]|nr:prepilin-type N-terminal cleavage/methylation domain-containing protein [Planctomycetota bacterium]